MFPLIGPPKGINTVNMFFVFLCNFEFYINEFGLFPGVLEGLGSSGRLIGSFSTYPGSCQCPWSRVMTENPGGDFFVTVHGRSIQPFDSF